MVPRRLVHLSVVLLLSTLSCQFIQSMIPLGGNSAAVGGALLNEVLFLPAQGEADFVEIKSPGKRVSLEGLYLMNERGDSYSLPDGVNTLSSDQFLLILFDGTNIVEDKTIHASLTGFLNPESGFIELYASDGTLLDRVAWGVDRPASVNLSRGAIPSDFVPGTTIGRFPASTAPQNRFEWVLFVPGEATPGIANLNPGVKILLPLDGALLEGPSVSLGWYPIAGAAQYRVQVAVDESFATPILDRTEAGVGLATDALSPGEYFWRVQAISGDDSTADYSPVYSFRVGSLSQATHLSAPARQSVLPVPWIMQRKDTGMLLLESKNENGAHAWDKDHVVLDADDPADNMNCALASAAMVNAFYGGKVSQDRIGYELYKDVWPGPEYDLNYGNGMWAGDVLPFVLGAPVVELDTATGEDEFVTDIGPVWEAVRTEIDAGRPIVAVETNHAFVITGYHEDSNGRWVMVNDPWDGQYAVDVEQLAIWVYYLLPSKEAADPFVEEPEIHQDSDGDGMVDFDESERFHTDPLPGGEDSDKDDVKDKVDVRASVFDEKYGYALTGELKGRDYDGDGIAMELDEDSDGGGCFDGMEDFDPDGKYKEPETYNFDEKDDACFRGTHELLLDHTSIYDDGSSHHQRIHTYVTFSLQAVEEGKLEGLAQIAHTHTGEFSSSECSGTHTIGSTQFYQATLKGEFQKMPDGGTFVRFDAIPNRGPDYIVDWVSACPFDPEVQAGWYWGGMSGTLKDGVFDLYNDFSSGTEEFWQKVHMEQGQGME